MTEKFETNAETCGSPDCFYCHLNNAVGAFVGSGEQKMPVSPEQAEAMLTAIGELAGQLLAGAPRERGHQFIGAVMIAQRKAEIEARNEASSAFIKAIFESALRRPRN